MITGDPGTRPRLGRPGVIQTGKIADVRSAIAASAISVVPIRFGGGTRMKILESLALGTPVVTTSKGVEGLELRSGEHLLIADSPSEFVRAIVQLLRDPEYARALAQRGYTAVRSRYHSQVIVPQFMRLVNQAVCPALKDETPVFA
jgi:glycosyltransferase involved in cell wall biosynthesis